ncbi:MAG: hypothetical protein V4736_04990 [Bdellovibrionota bacterium]
MKNLILSTALCLIGAVSQAAELSVTLTDMQINGEAAPGRVAVVIVNTDAKTIEVQMMDDMCSHYLPTPPGVVKCMAMPAPRERLSVPLLKTENSCGSVTYSGQEGTVFADGKLTKVSVTDNSLRVCDDVIPALYVLNATVEGGITGMKTTYKGLGNNRPLILEPMIDHKAIYEALKAKEVNVNPGIVGSGNIQKSVGGLKCNKMTVIYMGSVPSYDCQLAAKNNAKAIYSALNVQESNENAGSPIVGNQILSKKVGGLECYKQTVVYPGAKPSYSCNLTN